MKVMTSMAARKERGFTLIELVMVIVILGILAAFALPRFADLGGDAREATIRGAAGAVKSAAAIAHSKWLAEGSPGTVTSGNFDAGSADISLEGTNIDMTQEGYPETIALPTDGSAPTGIAAAAQIEASDFTLDSSGVFSIEGTAEDECEFTYNDTTGKVSGLEIDGC